MYKITSIKDRNGAEKTDFYNEMQAVHPNMSGEILYPKYTKVGGHFCLVWDDDTEKMLRTSTIEEMTDNGDVMTIVTRNSVYTLDKVGDNNKIELIRLKFDDSVSYKYKPFKYCCEAITKNKTIEFTNESPSEDFYGICDEEFRIIPYFASWFSETIKDWEDEWENDYYFPIKFCPHCGEHIEIIVVGEEDRTEEYLELKKQRDELWKKCQRTDSKKKEEELRLQVCELDSKIDWFYALCEYVEVK